MRQLNIQSEITLNNGIKIPILGLGTYLADSGGEAKKAVLKALEIGYRHIDTAMMYNNETDIGTAIKESGIPREEIFLTSKLWNSDHGFDRSLNAFQSSLDRLQVDYLDLYLIHWPVPELRLDSWRAMESLYAEGKCRTIGVSNYMRRHLEELLEVCDTVPMVNQVEFSPYLYLHDLLRFCRDQDIQLESYSPLTKGRMLNDPAIKAVAKKYERTTAQILIRWVLQHEVVVIPKSSNADRIYENSDVFDFSISDNDMELLNSFHKGLHTSWDPSTVP
ncbi:MAG: aldo/keto reductase [Candidatus Neomarinimicrobiota bacterium]